MIDCFPEAQAQTHRRHALLAVQLLTINMRQDIKHKTYQREAIEMVHIKECARMYSLCCYVGRGTRWGTSSSSVTILGLVMYAAFFQRTLYFKWKLTEDSLVYDQTLCSCLKEFLFGCRAEHGSKNMNLSGIVWHNTITPTLMSWTSSITTKATGGPVFCQ